jgi:hypothetical protein
MTGSLGHTGGAWRSFAAALLLCAASSFPLPAGAATAPQIKLAMFDFELEDFSAAGSGAVSPSDAAQLASVTSEIRKLLEESGRYQFVDAGDADEAAKSHILRKCKGCEAAIASKAGADQSLLGVVTRISRTEYTVTLLVRDARSGAVVSYADSGLRMGADYSWNRGAARLVRDRLLAGAAKQ